MVSYHELLVLIGKLGTIVALLCRGVFESSFSCGRRVQDDRQKLNRHLDELLRTVRNIALEREGVARMEDIGLLAVPVFNHTFQHMNELGAGMLEDRKSFS